MEKSGTRFSVCFRCPQPRSAAPRILGKAADLSPTPTNCGPLSANPSLPLIVFPGLSAKIFWWFFPLSFGHKKADLNLFWWVPHFSATPFWTFLSPSPSVVEKKQRKKERAVTNMVLCDFPDVTELSCGWTCSFGGCNFCVSRRPQTARPRGEKLE